MLTVDRQMGLNIVHPEGKPAKTVFNLVRYDANTDTSVVKCEPHTGRSHQLRVHLQYLGYPIANDPVYSDKKIWGENVGKGGLDLAPSDERSAPAAPEHLKELTEQHGSPESLAKDAAGASFSAMGESNEKGGKVGASEEAREETKEVETPVKPKLLPRETGEDIGMGSPVPLSAEAVGVITRLRNMKVRAFHSLLAPDVDVDLSRMKTRTGAGGATSSSARRAPSTHTALQSPRLHSKIAGSEVVRQDS